MVNWTMTTQQVSQVIIRIIPRCCVMHTMQLRPDANATFCAISCCGQTMVRSAVLMNYHCIHGNQYSLLLLDMYLGHSKGLTRRPGASKNKVWDSRI